MQTGRDTSFVPLPAEVTALLDALLGPAPLGVALFDADLRYLWVNDALAAENGRPPADHLGRRFVDLFPHLRESYLPTLERVRDDGDSTEVDIEGPVPGHGGEVRTARTALHPILGPDGRAGVGVVVIDTTDRVRAQRDLAATATLLDAALQRQRAALDALQHGFLPRVLPTLDGVELRARYLAAGDVIRVGGDWYDALATSDGALYVGIGDVAGHGEAAVEVMGQLRNAARAWCLDGLDPAAVLGRLDGLLAVTAPSEIATAVVGAYDPLRARVRLAVAGHPPPMLVGADGGAALVPARPGPPLGAVPGVRYRSSEVTIRPGEALVLYTDGLVERRDEVLDVGLERLRAALAGAARTAPGVALDQLVDAALTVLPATADRFDDACVLALRAAAPPATGRA